MSRFDWPLFAVLLVLGIVSYSLGLPYTFALSPLGMATPPAALALIIGQSAAILVAAIAIGQYFGSPVGLGAPVLSAVLDREPVADRVRSFALPAVLWGAGVGVALIVIDFALLVATGQSTAVAGLPPLWTRVLATFYGGIFEELLLRFGVMSLFVWLAWKVRAAPDGGPTTTGVWVAIVLAAIFFAVGHLPIAAAMGNPITPYLVGRSVLLNGIAGVVFGWFFWRRGIEAAMLSHFTADVALHVVGLSLLDLFL